MLSLILLIIFLIYRNTIESHIYTLDCVSQNYYEKNHVNHQQLLLPNVLVKIKKVIFYHVCTLGNWENIVDEQLMLIKNQVYMILWIIFILDATAKTVI